MILWNEWECPCCRRIGQVSPDGDYEDGEYMPKRCPHCGEKIVVVCEYQPAFVAYRPENWEAVEHD